MAAKRRSSWAKWLLILAVLGAAVGAGVVYKGKFGGSEPVEYKTAAVSRGDLIQAVTANGSLNPVRNIEVGSQISGTLLEVKVDFNDKVKAGDIIAQIDPATYERALVQAEAELANATAGLELAQLNFTRAKELFAGDLIAKSEFDTAKVGLTQAEAGVKMRQANVERARVDLARTTIHAPIDGIVISRKVEVGQTVAASLNSPTLFVIANDLAKMQIEAAVSEADVGGVEEGMTVNFTVDAFPTRQFKGIIKQVRFAPITNQNVVTYTTVVDVENREMKLRPGMTANAQIITSERKGALRIPNAALRFRPPANAIVLGATNSAAADAAKPEIATSGPFAGLPVPPWMKAGERRRATDQERADYEATLTAEQKQKYQQIMAEMRARFARSTGEGGGGFGGGGQGPGGGERRRAEPEGPRTQTVYLAIKETGAGGERTVLKPVTVKVGVSDGTNTEVIEGLKDGDIVASGTVTQVAAAPTPPGGSPFGGSPFGRGGR